MNSMPMHEWCLGFWWECRFSSLHGRWAAGAGLGMSANARSSGNTCVQNVKESRSELRTHKHGQGETSLAVKAIGGRESSEPMRLCDFQESLRPNHILLLPSLWNTILYRHNMGQTTRRYLAIQSCPRARLNTGSSAVASNWSGQGGPPNVSLFGRCCCVTHVIWPIQSMKFGRKHLMACDCLGTFDETGYNQMAPCSGLYWVCSGRR